MNVNMRQSEQIPRKKCYFTKKKTLISHTAIKVKR